MEETISLRELMETMKKRLRMIVLITVLAALISGLISFFILTPIYQASTQLLVNQSKNDQQMYDFNQVQANLQLVNTYSVIIKSPAVLEKVIKELKLDMTPETLNQKITVDSEQNSQVLNVSVQDPDPDKAVLIANKIAEVFKKEIVKIMNVDNVSILSKANLGKDMTPVKPKPLLNIAIAVVVGLMAGVGLAFLLEYLDNTIKSEQDIEKLLELPVLGMVTTISDEEVKSATQRSSHRKQVRGETFGS
ncbi:MAG: capsular biosynthesis protein [Bacillales bacterium]|nr:capsular biosynthesis protein [Bacillales bacterium]